MIWVILGTLQITVTFGLTDCQYKLRGIVFCSSYPRREPVIEDKQTRKRPAKVTIHDVALRAKVSKSLVSLVLQDSPLVRAEKRAAVAAAIKELGYTPSAAARSLAGGSTGTIGLLVDDLSNPWYVKLAQGLREGLSEERLRMIVGDPHFFTFPGESRVSPFLQLRVDALVIAGDVNEADLLEQAARTIPTVVLGAPSVTMTHADLVVNDDQQGARLAVEHLIQHGHRRIAHIAGQSEAAQRRHQGYLQTMTKHGLETNVLVAISTEMTEEGGAQACRQLMESAQRPTAIFVGNDMMALGALNTADQLGLHVPEKLSIVGYDNTSIADIGRIALTTIDNVSYDIGLRGAQRLKLRLHGEAGPPVSQVLPPRLVIRGSTAPPAQ